LRLHDDRRHGRIDPHGEIVERDLDHALANQRRIVRVVGQGLQIGDENEGLVLVLQGDTIAERADVVAEV
jgi:hypothetical protein